MGGCLGGCYTGTRTQPSQGPILQYYSAEGPTHGQMKAFLRFPMRFPRKGLEKGPRMT